MGAFIGCCGRRRWLVKIIAVHLTVYFHSVFECIMKICCAVDSVMSPIATLRLPGILIKTLG